MTRRAEAWRPARGGRAIERVFVLRDFDAAAALIARVAALARARDHHPDLHLTRYRRLRVVLGTREAGRVTRLDRGMAAAVDALARRQRPR